MYINIQSGAICVLWSLVALFLIYDSPALHPRVDVAEKQYLLSFQTVRKTRVH